MQQFTDSLFDGILMMTSAFNLLTPMDGAGRTGAIVLESNGLVQIHYVLVTSLGLEQLTSSLWMPLYTFQVLQM